MPVQRRVSLLVGWLGIGLLLGAVGCQLQIAFVDGTPKSPDPARQPGVGPAAPSESQPSSLQQVNYPNAYPGSNTVAAPIPMGPERMPDGAIINPGSLPPGTVNVSPAPSPGMPMPGAPVYGMPTPAMPLPGPGATPGHGPGGPPLPPPGFLPTEKQKTSHPPYVIEPPDILLLNPIRLVPRPPYMVGPFDVLLVRLAQPLPNQPLDGTFTIAPDGTINLGYNHGLVRAGGLTIEEVEKAIRAQLSRSAGLKEPQVAVGLVQYRGIQQTRGQHLVRQDGTIDLGSYGCVHVAGLTLAQAKVAIERHLGPHLLDPEVSVDVLAYNSKVYYVIFDGAGYGMAVYRFPITGNETVLDAVAQIQGLPAVASLRKMWVARPAPPNHPCMQILPVDWLAITQGGVTTTNYQLFPGDRLYVQSDCLIRTDNVLAKIFAPVERILGLGLLAGSVGNVFRSNGNGGNGTGTAFIAPIR